MNRPLVLAVLGAVIMVAGTATVGVYHFEKEKEAKARQAQAALELDEARRLMAEERKGIEEERARLDKMKGELEEEKKGLGEREQKLRSDLERLERQVAAARQESASAHAPPAAQKPRPAETSKQPRAAAQRKPDDKKSVETRVPPERKASGRMDTTEGAWRVSVGGDMPMSFPGRHDVGEIVNRAVEDAAATQESVVFTNTRTGERVRADPAGYNRMGVRIRVRAWEKGELVRDSYERSPY